MDPSARSFILYVSELEIWLKIPFDNSLYFLIKNLLGSIRRFWATSLALTRGRDGVALQSFI